MKNYVYFGAKKRFSGWNDTVKSAVTLEKEIIKILADIMKSGNDYQEVFKEKTVALEKKLFDYGYIMCHVRNMTYYERIKSLERMLKFLLVFPVKYKINVDIIEDLNKRFWLLDMLSFGLSQVSDKALNSGIIDSYLTYLKDCSSCKLSVLFLYRLNPDYVKSNYILGEVWDLKPTELYYSITTGYFSMKDEGKAAIDRLKELSSKKELSLLKKSGFITEK